MRTYRIGTRKSPLALAQALEVIRALKKKWRSLKIQTVPISTAGDEFQSVELFKRVQEGVFTKAIEKKLLRREIDLAVHSLKDLPTTLPKGLRLAAVLKRADTADALVSKKAYDLASLPVGACVGTGSPRRKFQLKRLRPDLRVEDLRGNLGTRVSKTLKENRYDAVLVARAGLLRVRKYLKFAKRIDPNVLLPAVGQAAIAIQARSSDKEILHLVAGINDGPSETEVRAERAFLKKLHGGCRIPAGVHTAIEGRQIKMRAGVYSVRNGKGVEASIAAPAQRPEKAGERLAKELLKKGAGKFLKEARL